MFDPNYDFEKEEEKYAPRVSRIRYKIRLKNFEKDGKPHAQARHEAHWLLHNVIVHPLLGLFPGKLTTKLHDLSSGWLNHSSGRVSPPPVIENHKTWLKHNIISHILIGLMPCDETFELHDRTAREMKVKGWV